MHSKFEFPTQNVTHSPSGPSMRKCDYESFDADMFEVTAAYLRTEKAFLAAQSDYRNRYRLERIKRGMNPNA